MGALAPIPSPYMNPKIKQKLQIIKQQLTVVKLVATHPRTPWLSRIMLLAALAYAASPIDLIPDFIPVIGYLDDLLIVPSAIWLAYRLVPPGVIAECKLQAAQMQPREEQNSNDPE